MKLIDKPNRHKRYAIVFILGYILLIANSCKEDFTNKPREDRIELKMVTSNNLIDCDTVDGLIPQIIMEVIFPENFDHIIHHYEEPCTFQYVDNKRLLLDLGSIKDVHSYLLIDTILDRGQFYYFTDRNQYDGLWWFKFGELLNSGVSKLKYSLRDNAVKIDVEATIKRELFKKEDLDMSDLLGYSDYFIHGCAMCYLDDLTVDRVILKELDYLEKHKEAISNPSEFKEKLQQRLGSSSFRADSIHFQNRERR